MKTLAKIGAAMALLAIIMTAGFYNVLQAKGVSSPADPAERALASETRAVGAGVAVVRLNGSIHLKVKQGVAPGLIVRAEQRLLSNIVTAQNGNTLTIETKGLHFFSGKPIQIELTLPSLQELQVHGSGDADLRGFTGEAIQLALFGSGSITLNGQYKRIKASVRGSGDMQISGGTSEQVDLNQVGSGDITINGDSKILKAKLTGSGDLHARQLIADTAELNLHGSGDADIHARQTANLTLAGSGDIEVYGKPTQRSVNRAGSGDVSWN